MKLYIKVLFILIVSIFIVGCGNNTGNVEGTLTWQHIGTQGDVEARVALIPTDLDKSLDHSGFVTLVSQHPQGEHGIYTTKADGYGHYVLSDVPPGEYCLLFVSRNATTHSNEDNISLMAKPLLKPLFDDKEWESLKLKLMLYKHDVRAVKIKHGKTITESYDFGHAER